MFLILSVTNMQKKLNTGRGQKPFHGTVGDPRKLKRGPQLNLNQAFNYAKNNHCLERIYKNVIKKNHK